MANNFLYKNNVIWKCSNGMLSALHEELSNIILQNNIHDNEIKNFLELTDQNSYGLGCIVFDFSLNFESTKSIKFFLNFFSMVIEKTSRKYQWTPELKQHAYSLINQLNYILDKN